MTDDIDIELERAIADAATEGPWFTPDERRLQGAVSARIGERECQVASIDGDAAMFDRRAETHEIQRANAAFIARARTLVPRLLDALEQARKELAEKHVALTKISAIRDSVVGMQGFNFSEHAYPLVAVLDAAGYKGAGYEISRANLGTLIDQRDLAIAERDALRQQLEAVTRERDEARAEISRLRDYREGKRKDDGYAEGDYEAVASNIADDPRWANRSDSQLVARWALTLRRERDSARAAGAWKPSEVWREEVVDETAEAIAVHFESKLEQRSSMTVGPMLTCSEVAAEVRAGAWRAKEGK